MRRFRRLAAILFFMLSIPMVMQAQDRFQLLSEIPCTATYLTVDHLGNLYTLEGSRLTCLDSNLRVKRTFSNLVDGVYSSVDVADPLKIVLFSREFDRIRFLDQNLAPKASEMDLMDLGHPNVSLVCTSFESGFWILDASSMELSRYNSGAVEVQNSGNISALIGLEVNPLFMSEFSNTLYLVDSSQGIFVFDRYGAYLKHWPFKGVCYMQAWNEDLILFTQNELILFNPDQRTTTSWDYPVASFRHFKDVVSACIFGHYLFVLTGDQLQVYAFH